MIDNDRRALRHLQKIMRATIDDLDDVEGVGDARARAIKEGLSRLAETQHPRPLQLTPKEIADLMRIELPSGTPAELAEARRRRGARAS